MILDEAEPFCSNMVIQNHDLNHMEYIKTF